LCFSFTRWLSLPAQAWKRNLFFSSPGASLYAKNVLKKQYIYTRRNKFIFQFRVCFRGQDASALRARHLPNKHIHDDDDDDDVRERARDQRSGGKFNDSVYSVAAAAMEVSARRVGLNAIIFKCTVGRNEKKSDKNRIIVLIAWKCVKDHRKNKEKK
jgi:hypothetical protein